LGGIGRGAPRHGVALHQRSDALDEAGYHAFFAAVDGNKLTICFDKAGRLTGCDDGGVGVATASRSPFR
jgi:hypothetical protein